MLDCRLPCAVVRLPCGSNRRSIIGSCSVVEICALRLCESTRHSLSCMSVRFRVVIRQFYYFLSLSVIRFIQPTTSPDTMHNCWNSAHALAWSPRGVAARSCRPSTTSTQAVALPVRRKKQKEDGEAQRSARRPHPRDRGAPPRSSCLSRGEDRPPWRSRVREHLRHLVHGGRERAACGVAKFGLLEVGGAFLAEPLHLGQQEVVHELARDRAGR